ncbi:MAG: magnesium protoporphyrin IX methyltransferase [Sodalinema sp.]|uniref:magnesium protoporphyrin IX methyltransferase n=1 Tax=Sodalinema sp. TaxID=3080550 RepID=UPI0012153B4B|nr:MAG: magnesium protoporphyrin IX methyltransferase [Phormidium sp. SL48-SHIP]
MIIIDEKSIVKEYFNTTGFDRWRRIYGKDEVNKVQLDIREGHQQTIDKVVGWLSADGNLGQLTICDAGCGVGSLSLPLAEAGATVYGSDISEMMVTEAQERAQAQLSDSSRVRFETRDLEEISGNFHTVICLDVLIHYPDDKMDEMLSHLCSLAESRVILSFAPKTPWLTVLKKVGELFPGPSKTTRAYQHREADILAIFAKNGFQPARTEMTSTRFYYSRLVELVRG